MKCVFVFFPQGFFRRSIQKKIEYRCLRDEKCLVIRLNRNRCQFCRFKKCMDVGMSRDCEYTLLPLLTFLANFCRNHSIYKRKIYFFTFILFYLLIYFLCVLKNIFTNTQFIYEYYTYRLNRLF